MKITLPMMAVLGLIMSALPAQSGNIPISSLPVNITAPGTYAVTGNLSYPVYGPAIVIANNVAGEVILDLRGFTLTGAGETASNQASFGVSIGYYQVAATNPYPIIIRNGTLENFTVGIDAQQGGGSSLTNLTVDNLTITHPAAAPIQTTAVTFSCSFSTVSNCRISDYEMGIGENEYGAGNNSFKKNTFTNVSFPLWLMNTGTITTPIVVQIPLITEQP